MTINRNLLLGASSMTPVERAMGRFMRAPDHPAAPAPAAPAAEEAPAAPAVPEAVEPKTVEDLYDEEFGGSVDPEEPKEEKPASEEPPVDNTDDQPKEEAAPPKENDEAAAARREAEAARAEADRYRREADELRRNQPKEEAKEEQQQEESRPAQRPNPDDYEFGEADSKFIEDLAEWKANETFARRQQEADAREQESRTRAEIAEMDASWKEAIAAPDIAEQYPDFSEKVVDGAAKDAWKCSIPMTIAIKSSPVGAHVAYELATNAAESARIADLSPMEQMLEIGRLEGKYLAQAASKGAAPDGGKAATPKPTKAPEPPAARSRGAGGQFASEQDAVYDRFLKEMR